MNWYEESCLYYSRSLFLYALAGHTLSDLEPRNPPDIVDTRTRNRNPKLPIPSCWLLIIYIKENGVIIEVEFLTNIHMPRADWQYQNLHVHVSSDTRQHLCQLWILREKRYPLCLDNRIATNTTRQFKSCRLFGADQRVPRTRVAMSYGCWIWLLSLYTPDCPSPHRFKTNKALQSLI